MKRSLAFHLGVLAVLVTFVPVASGCGVVFGGTRQVIHTSTGPEGARVTTEPGTGDYTTPSSISLERKTNYTLVFTKPGYRTARIAVQRSLRAGILVLDIVVGLVGVIVDAATGAWYSLSPREVNVVLEKEAAAMPGPDRIIVALRITDNGQGQARLQVSSDEPVGVRVLPQ